MCQPLSCQGRLACESAARCAQENGLAAPDALAAAQAELCLVLHAFPFFQNFDDAHGIARLCECVLVPKGTPLFVQGDWDEDGIYFVLQGLLGIHLHSSASDSQIGASAAPRLSGTRAENSRVLLRWRSTLGSSSSWKQPDAH